MWKGWHNNFVFPGDFSFIKNMFCFTSLRIIIIAALKSLSISFNICLISGYALLHVLFFENMLYSLGPSWNVTWNLCWTLWIPFYGKSRFCYFSPKRKCVLTGFCLGWAWIANSISYISPLVSFQISFVFKLATLSLLCPCIVQSQPEMCGTVFGGPLSGSFP